MLLQADPNESCFVTTWNFIKDLFELWSKVTPLYPHFHYQLSSFETVWFQSIFSLPTGENKVNLTQLLICAAGTQCSKLTRKGRNHYRHIYGSCRNIHISQISSSEERERE